MRDKDSNNSVYWWIVFIVYIICAIVFYFDKKNWWPELKQPVLRCLVAPVGGILILIWISIIAPAFGWPVIVAIYRFITTPLWAFWACLLLSIGVGISLLFRWAVVPVGVIWTIIDSSAISILVGFIIVGLLRIFKTDSWVLRSVLSVPIAIGLAFWLTLKLDPGQSVWWGIVTTIIMLAFLLRFIYEELERIGEGTANHYQPLVASSLTQEMKELILKQVKDQIGTTKYNQLVNTVGEDELIDQVLANMNKSS